MIGLLGELEAPIEDLQRYKYTETMLTRYTILDHAGQVKYWKQFCFIKHPSILVLTFRSAKFLSSMVKQQFD